MIYLTVEFLFTRPQLTPDLVESFYASLFKSPVAFGGVCALGCPADLSLEEVVLWNQTKLDSNFTLRDDEHISNDFRQVWVAGTPFSECRVFIDSDESWFSFCLVVPDNVKPSQVAVLWLVDTAIRVWINVPMQNVQAYGELGHGASMEELQRGECPAVDPFAIVPNLPRGDLTEYEIEIQQLAPGYLLSRRDGA